MKTHARTAPLLAALAALPLLAGCRYTSQTYHFDKAKVWSAAAGQAVAWHPDSIDEDDLSVESVKTDLAGNEIRYRLEVATDLNPFVRRPSTRVFVRMERIKPSRERFSQLEQDFLAKVQARLHALNPPPQPAP